MFNLVKKQLINLYITAKNNPTLLFLLLISALYFITYYFTDPIRPVFAQLHETALYPQGWLGWHDQGQYILIAHALSSFNFHELISVYSYGLGYPATAIPFIWLGFDKDPFVFFNFITFVFATYSIYRVATHFISPTAGWIAGFGLVFATPLINYTALPWNSTVCLFAMSGILLMATTSKIKKWHMVTAGILVGWAFAARYIDIVWLAPLAMASLYRENLKNSFKQLPFVLIGMAIIVIPVLYSHYKAFGSPFKTPYVNHLGINGVGGSDQELGAYDVKRIPNASLGMLLSPRLAGSTDIDRGLIINMFWILAAIPGAFVLLRKKKGRIFFITLITVTVLATLFYMSFRASTPDSIKYGTLHYLKMFWPGLVIFAVAFIDFLFSKNAKYSKK